MDGRRLPAVMARARSWPRRVPPRDRDSLESTADVRWEAFDLVTAVAVYEQFMSQHTNDGGCL
jgi:hypothetical protein